VKALFAATKADLEKRKNTEKPYLCIPLAKLRQMVAAHQQKARVAKKQSPLSDYDRTIQKFIDAEKKKKKMTWTRKGVPQLGEQVQQSLPPLVVGKEYGSNVSMLDQIPGELSLKKWEFS
jgi:hypothetical protein